MSPRTLARYSLFALILACAVFGAGIAVRYADPASGDPANDPIEVAFLTIINEYRASHSKGPLVIDPRLSTASDWLATDMATRDYVSHTDSLNRSTTRRLEDIIGEPLPYTAWSENVAGGYSTAQAVFEGWEGSPSHDARMLGDFDVIGIALVCEPNTTYVCYWATDFGKVLGAVPSTPAATASATPIPSPTPTPPASATHSPSPTSNESPSTTAVPTESPAASPSTSPTATPTQAPFPAVTVNGISVLLSDLDIGGTELTIGSGGALGIEPGDFLAVNPGGLTEEVFLVQGLDPIELDHLAQHDHDIGELVIRIHRGDTDCDDEITPYDLLNILEQIADIGAPGACQSMGDANCDSQPSSLDAIWIALRAALVVSFRAQNCDAVGGGLPASTQTTEAAPAGADLISVLNTNGFHIGDTIRINPGGANEEENVITGIGSFVLQSPLIFSHDAGEVIVKVLTVPPLVPMTPTPTPSPTPAPTETPTDTPTPSPTLPACDVAVAEPQGLTETSSPTPTATPTETSASTPTDTPFTTPTENPTGTPCATPSPTLVACDIEGAQSLGTTGTPSPTPTTDPASTSTATPTDTSPSTPTGTPCATPSPTGTPTDTPAPTPTETATPTPTEAPTPSPTPA